MSFPLRITIHICCYRHLFSTPWALGNFRIWKKFFRNENIMNYCPLSFTSSSFFFPLLLVTILIVTVTHISDTIHEPNMDSELYSLLYNYNWYIYAQIEGVAKLIQFLLASYNLGHILGIFHRLVKSLLFLLLAWFILSKVYLLI